MSVTRILEVVIIINKNKKHIIAIIIIIFLKNNIGYCQKIWEDNYALNILANILIPVLTVVATLLFQWFWNKTQESKEIRISAYNIYTDIVSKISSIKNALKLTEIDDKNKNIFFPPLFSYQYMEINSYLKALSNQLSSMDLSAIKAFYSNYEVRIQSIINIMESKNLTSYDFKSFTDKEIQTKLCNIEYMYKNCIYNFKELDLVMNKLFKLSKLDEFNNGGRGFKKIDFSISIEDLKKTYMNVI